MFLLRLKNEKIKVNNILYYVNFLPFFNAGGHRLCGALADEEECQLDKIGILSSRDNRPPVTPCLGYCRAAGGGVDGKTRVGIYGEARCGIDEKTGVGISVGFLSRSGF